MCAVYVARFGSNLVHAACLTVALTMPRVRDVARCCVRKLVVAHISSLAFLSSMHLLRLMGEAGPCRVLETHLMMCDK